MASIGASMGLVAAGALLLLVLSGIVAFKGWPGFRLHAGDPGSTALPARPSAGASRTAALALTAAPPAGTDRATVTRDRRGATRRTGDRRRPGGHTTPRPGATPTSPDRAVAGHRSGALR